MISRHLQTVRPVGLTAQAARSSPISRSIIQPFRPRFASEAPISGPVIGIDLGVSLTYLFYLPITEHSRNIDYQFMVSIYNPPSAGQ